MNRVRILQCILLVAFWMVLTGAAPMKMHPLAPPDTSSPRRLVMSFLDAADKAYRMHISGERQSTEIDYYVARAIRCLDMREVAPSVRKD